MYQVDECFHFSDSTTTDAVCDSFDQLDVRAFHLLGVMARQDFQRYGEHRSVQVFGGLSHACPLGTLSNGVRNLELA